MMTLISAFVFAVTLTDLCLRHRSLNLRLLSGPHFHILSHMLCIFLQLREVIDEYSDGF